MLAIRPARSEDEAAILQILEAADLRYAAESLDHFYVAELDQRVVGIGRLEPHADFFFLTSLGIAPQQQKRGIASALVKELIKQADKPIYLYTIIPDFFQRFGFTVTHNYPQLPAKTIFGCQECFPDQCVVMKR